MEHWKIGYDAKRAFRNQAGLGNYSRNTLTALQKFFPQHNYILYTPDVRTDIFKENPLFDVRYPTSLFYKVFRSFWRNFALARTLQNDELDLYHGLSNELPSGIHKTGIPSVVTMHDLIFLNFPLWYKPVDRKIYLEKSKYACQVASKIIAISNHTREDLIKHLHVEPERIEVIYQSISERYFFHSVSDQVDDVLAKYNLPAQYLLTVGTIEPRKNQLSVIKAIYNKGLDIPYVIIGKPTPYLLELKEYIGTHRMREQVYILDNVPDIDMPALYQQAMCMVCLSHYEGFGLPVIEAMASGCPVIASSVSCLPEIGENAALYCEPNDDSSLGNLILKVMNDTSLRKELAERGRLRAKFFHPEERVTAVMNLYESVIKGE
jgi:glycosyltransferase involved in cell wall biosynthesis